MRNESYYKAAYAVAVVIYAIYAGSLWWRSRTLARREAAVAEALARGGGSAERSVR